jgi:hypothetical protein
MFDMPSLKERASDTFKFFMNPVAVGLIILALGVFYLAASMTTLSIELAQVRRDMPPTLDRIDKQLDRVDKQISSVNKILKGSENAGKEFTSGVNKGISSGIIDIPVNTVNNVGEKLKDTAVNTGKSSYGFWNAIKEKLPFWKPVTKEAQAKPQNKK